MRLLGANNANRGNSASGADSSPASFRLVLGVLTVWRITRLLNAEDGPWSLSVHIRRRVGRGFWGTVLDCFYCLSLWVAAPVAVLAGRNHRERMLLWPALSAGAVLLEQATVHRAESTVPMRLSSIEEPDELLRG
jgi:hypothetical protein